MAAARASETSEIEKASPAGDRGDAQKDNLLVKIALIGDEFVGKTSLMVRKRYYLL